MFDHTPLPAPTEQLQKGGYDMRKLTHAILSHAHFDRTSYAPTIPSCSVLSPGRAPLLSADTAQTCESPLILTRPCVPQSGST